MPFGTPSNPVSGTVITVAYAVANILDPLRWLRSMTGNADPPGTSYVVVSTSPTSTAWMKVPSDALAAGAAAANVQASGISSFTCSGTFTTGSISCTGNLGVGGQVSAQQYTGGTTAAGGVSAAGFAAGGAGVSSTGPIDAGNSQISTTGTVQAGVFNGGTTASGGVSAQGVAAGGAGISSAGQFFSSLGPGSAPINVSSTTQCPNLNAAFLNGLTASDILAASGGGSIVPLPSGMIVAFQQASEIPSGWGRYTAADGRFLVGAGAASGTANTPAAFAENSNAGSSDWQHTHGQTSVGVTLSSVSISSVSLSGHATGGATDFAGASTSTLNGRFTAGGGNALPDNHTHPLNGISLNASVGGTVAGSTAGGTLSSAGATSAGTTAGFAWIPPSRAVVWARKT